MTKRMIEQQRRRLYFNQGREKEWIACRKSGCRADRENGKILTVRTFQAAKDSLHMNKLRKIQDVRRRRPGTP